MMTMMMMMMIMMMMINDNKSNYTSTKQIFVIRQIVIN